MCIFLRPKHSQELCWGATFFQCHNNTNLSAKIGRKHLSKLVSANISGGRFFMQNLLKQVSSWRVFLACYEECEAWLLRMFNKMILTCLYVQSWILYVRGLSTLAVKKMLPVQSHYKKKIDIKSIFGMK